MIIVVDIIIIMKSVLIYSILNYIKLINLSLHQMYKQVHCTQYHTQCHTTLIVDMERVMYTKHTLISIYTSLIVIIHSDIKLHVHARQKYNILYPFYILYQYPSVSENIP